MHNPLADSVRLPPGIVYPTPDLAADIGVRRLWRRPDIVRFFVRVGAVVLDAKGNAREARVEHLDLGPQGPTWRPWALERRLCWDGFRFTLKDTPRAGLHIRIGLPVPGSPVDRHGYRTMEPTFLASVKVAKEGIIVLTPSSSLRGGYALSELESDDVEERQLLVNVLTARFGTTPDQAALFLE